MTLSQLAERIGAELRPAGHSDGQTTVDRCLGLDDAGPSDVSFLANPRYAEQLRSTDAAAVIVAPDVACDDRTLLVADDPYFAFRNAVVALHGFRQHPTPADGPVSPQAIISEKANVDPSAVIHPFTVICDGATIGKNTVVYPHCFVGPDTSIGDDCVLYPNVVVYDRCEVGHRVTLHAGCVVGQDGFGYATAVGPGEQAPSHHKIPQVGNVVIEDDVELGANCAIDRATVGSTVIGTGSKFSDLVAIGHGTKVGAHNLLVALVGLAGSVETGNYVAMGGMVGVAGHLKVGDQAQIAATSGVMTDVPDKAQYGGTPAMPLTEAKRLHLHSIRLPDLFARVKKLERELDKLRKSNG